MKTIAFKCLLCFAFLTLSLFRLSAQDMMVSGQVWDGAMDEPMAGVNVSVVGTTTGTSTDADGNFTLRVKAGQKLQFSFLGYKDELVTVKADKFFMSVEMTADSEMLEELVVVGYGQQKKASSVGSISTAKGEDLMKAGNVTSVSEALQGQMPGVVSINTTSKPGADAASIYVRGRATWGNTNPLVLVDGIERDFNDVDINEIESISVLKDASATAVYGVKGANGVILLTTKRGENKKTSVNFSANVGFKQPTTKYEWADYPTTMEIYNEAAMNDNSWDKIIPESTMEAWRNAYATGLVGPYSDYFPEVDWWDQCVKDFGLQQTYNLNIRGGSERVNYFASVGFLNDGDIFNIQKNDDFDPRFYYKRYNWRTNFDFNITKTTKLSVNIAGKMAYRNQPGYRDPEGGDGYIFKPLIQAPSNMFPVQWSDGYWGSDNVGNGNAYSQMNYQGQRQYTQFQGFYDISLKQDLKMITKGLSLKASVSYTTYQNKQASIFKAGIYGTNPAEAAKFNPIRYYRAFDYANPVYNEDGTVDYPLITEIRFPDRQDADDDLPVAAAYDSFSGHGRELYYEIALNYDRAFKGGHNVTALALFNRRVSDTAGQFSSFEEDWVGRVTYNYKERYLFEANGAYTGSEKFAPGKRFGFFPSFSVGWRLSEEPFMAGLKETWLNNFKIRYSYGQVGSDRGAPRFNYIQTFSSSGSINFGMDQNVSFGPLYHEGRLAYENATWETSTKQNLGVEMTLFKNLRVTVDLFDEKREGILMSRKSLAPWIGAALPSVNIGKTKNHGLEFTLDWSDEIGKDFWYYAKFNFATSENRVVFRDDPNKLDDYLKDAGKPIGSQSKYIVSGNLSSIDDIFNYSGVELSKVTQNMLDPGDFAYIDYNADGVINDKDKVPMGHVTVPLTTYSLTLGFTWKGVSLNAMFYAATQVYKEQISGFLWDFPNELLKAQPNTLDRWTVADAASNEIIRPTIHLKDSYNSVGNTYTFVDHSYLRLKNVELSYNFPKRWLKAVKMTGLQLYVNGNNLWTLSSIDKRRDPETSSQEVYPIIKRYNVGVRVSF